MASRFARDDAPPASTVFGECEWSPAGGVRRAPAPARDAADTPTYAVLGCLLHPGIQGQDAVQEAKALIAELCASLYAQGHVSGTGGGLSIRVATDQGERIVMAPSGVQKERMHADDMFVLDGAGNVLHAPAARPPPYKPPKLSECAPLFMSVSMSGQRCLPLRATLNGRPACRSAAAQAPALPPILVAVTRCLSRPGL